MRALLGWIACALTFHRMRYLWSDEAGFAPPLVCSRCGFEEPPCGLFEEDE